MSIINVLMKNKFVSDLFSAKGFGQLKRYLITGFLSAGTELTLLKTLNDLISKMNNFSDTVVLIASNTISLTIIFWINFLLNRFWSFKSKDKLSRQLIIYGILFIFNLGASNFIMYLLSDILSFHYLISKVFSIGAVVSWNFIIYKKIIFK